MDTIQERDRRRRRMIDSDGGGRRENGGGLHTATVDGEILCTARRTQVPVGPAMFDLNRCNDQSPLRGEKPDFGQ